MPPIPGLTHYAELDGKSIWIEPSWATGCWFWMPGKWINYPYEQPTIEMFLGAGWEDVGSVAETSMALFVLASQLVDMRLTVTSDNEDVQHRRLWIPRADRERIEMLPVMLAFVAPLESQRQAEANDAGRQIYHHRPIPPPELGELGLILVKQDERIRPVRCKLKKLPEESQQLQRRMGAALTRLASARNLAPLAWIEQWEEIQRMARDLARAYWRTHQNAQVKPPAPINIWTIEKEGAFAAMTMVQEGAHAGIYHKDKWEQEHMIQSGKQSGISAPRFIHATKEHKTETEYWMQFPDEDDVPADPDLISQELLRQQAKLSDEMADLVMLAPIYLLARGEDEVYISPEQLLRDMDVTPKRKDGYTAGYRPEELQRVIEEFDRLAWIHLKTRQWIQKRRGVKPAVVTAESPYILVTERIWQEPLVEGEPRKFLGWKYQIGWLKAFTSNGDAGRQLGILLKKSFVYRQDQRWEKRLARYLTIHLGIAAHKGGSGIDCKIGYVLEQCGLAPTDRDRTRPGEYANQFEKAMDHLKRDGIVGDWLPRLDRNAPDFPTRDWLNLWLDSSFHVTHPPFALANGYQKMIDSATARREKATAKEGTPRQKQAPKQG